MSSKDSVLDLWSQGYTEDEICCATDFSREVIYKYLRMARAQGDERAARRIGRIPAMRRKRKIMELAQTIKDPAMIARKLGISTRIVQMRLKECR